MTSDELLPCPFCGGEVRMAEKNGGLWFIGHCCKNSSPNSLRMYVNDRWEGIGLESELEKQKKEAIKAWNTRVSITPDATALIEELAEALEELLGQSTGGMDGKWSADVDPHQMSRKALASYQKLKRKQTLDELTKVSQEENMGY